MHKLSRKSDDAWVPHSYPPVFAVETTAGTERLVAGVPGGDHTVFRTLVASLEPPLFVLYLLHTPRGEGVPGRYQSPPLSLSEFQAFLERYSLFLLADARHDIWAHSSADDATVVWDRHNLIYAYGPIERFTSVLRGLGFSHGTPNAAFPHQHHYRAEFDVDAASLLSAFEWSHSPLHPEDEQ
jgi:hypothetical protein